MISIVNHGSIVLVGPTEPDLLPFADFVADNVAGEPMFWGDALVVEPRFVSDLVAGLVEAGFQVEV